VLTAIVLAGGDSSRMGSPKALLTDPEGLTFVARIATAMRAAGLTDIVIVTGRHHDEIVGALDRLPSAGALRVMRNEEPSRGQLSSLWVGLDACRHDTDAADVTLVDVPFVAPATIAAVIAAWSNGRPPIVRPSFRGRRGHPVIFDRRLFDELRRAPLEVGARAVVGAHYAESVDVPVDDPGCLVDVDTPADYRRAIAPTSVSE
jgi:molybdenum cofactor cytidylyltransferase